MSGVVAYAVALDGASDAAKRQVFVSVMRGTQPGFDGKWCPTPAQLGQWCRKADEMIAALSGETNRQKLIPYGLGEPTPEGCEPLGPVKVNFGSREIDMSKMTSAEKDAVLRNKGLPKPDAKSPIPTLKRIA